jgi:hypothetical protein
MAGTEDLDEDFRPYAEAWYQFLRSIDPRFVITSARRSSTDQQRLYERMLEQKAAGEPYFTTLPPGHSQHERGLAVDIARFGVPAADDDLLREAGAAWRSWGGTWGGESDPVHFGAPKNW